MISPAIFALLHLAILLAVLVALGMSARPSRMGVSRHRGVRYRRLTSEDMMKRLVKSERGRR